MENSTLSIKGKPVQGVVIPLPAAPLVLLKAENGFVMCGYLNVEVANKLGVAAAVVSGVKTVEDVLKGSVKAVTVKAQEKGVQVGMTGQQAMEMIV